MNIIAIIPARSGSKGVPNKNIKKLNRKPLLNYSIEKLLKIKKINHIIVSSDSEKILNTYKKNSKKLIFLKRPKNISLDNSLTESTLIHAIGYYKKNFLINPDLILTIEPTSPFRNISTIEKAIDIMKKKPTYDSLITIAEETSNLGKVANSKFKFLLKDLPRRRQRRKNLLFKEVGVVYATRTSYLLKYKSVLGKKIFPLKVSKIESLDINDEIDFKIAEIISKIYF